MKVLKIDHLGIAVEASRRKKNSGRMFGAYV